MYLYKLIIVVLNSRSARKLRLRKNIPENNFEIVVIPKNNVVIQFEKFFNFDYMDQEFIEL